MIAKQRKLEDLLRLLQANRRGPQKVPPRQAKLEQLLARVQKAPRRTQ